MRGALNAERDIPLAREDYTPVQSADISGYAKCLNFIVMLTPDV